MIVLLHEGGIHDTVVLDFFAKKGDFIAPQNWEEELPYGYKVECSIAKRFLKEHPDYELVGSQDLQHCYERNALLLAELILRKDLQVYIYSNDKFEEIKL